MEKYIWRISYFMHSDDYLLSPVSLSRIPKREVYGLIILTFMVRSMHAYTRLHSYMPLLQTCFVLQKRKGKKKLCQRNWDSFLLVVGGEATKFFRFLYYPIMVHFERNRLASRWWCCSKDNLFPIYHMPYQCITWIYCVGYVKSY